MRTGKIRLVAVLGFIIVVIVLVPLVVVMMNRPRIPVVPLPTPNGFDTMVEAGKAVKIMPENYQELADVEILTAAVRANAQAMALIEDAEGQEAIVPIDYKHDRIAELTDRGAPIRQALRALYLKGRLEQFSDQPAAAAETYARMFKLGSESYRGGLLVHFLTACANEMMALDSLSEVIPKLDEDGKRTVLAVLESVGRDPVNLEEVMAREHALVLQEHGALYGRWMLQMTKGTSNPAMQHANDADARVLTINENVISQLRE